MVEFPLAFIVLLVSHSDVYDLFQLVASFFLYEPHPLHLNTFYLLMCSRGGVLHFTKLHNYFYLLVLCSLSLHLVPLCGGRRLNLQVLYAQTLPLLGSLVFYDLMPKQSCLISFNFYPVAKKDVDNFAPTIVVY